MDPSHGPGHGGWDALLQERRCLPNRVRVTVWTGLC